MTTHLKKNHPPNRPSNRRRNAGGICRATPRVPPAAPARISSLAARIAQNCPLTRRHDRQDTRCSRTPVDSTPVSARSNPSDANRVASSHRIPKARNQLIR